MSGAEPQRPWWQFRLRSLLLIMLLVAAYFAGWTTAKQSTRRSEAAARDQLRRALRAEQRARDQAFRQIVVSADMAADARSRLEQSEVKTHRAEVKLEELKETLTELKQQLPPGSAKPGDLQALDGGSTGSEE